MAPNAGLSYTDMVLQCVTPGGTLVLTGCDIFGTQQAIDFWQAEATDHQIYIIGSTTATTWPSNGGAPSGTWLELSPQ